MCTLLLNFERRKPITEDFAEAGIALNTQCPGAAATVLWVIVPVHSWWNGGGVKRGLQGGSAGMGACCQPRRPEPDLEMPQCQERTWKLSSVLYTWSLSVSPSVNIYVQSIWTRRKGKKPFQQPLSGSPDESPSPATGPGLPAMACPLW